MFPSQRVRVRDNPARLAVLCGLVFALAVGLVWPVCESGILDDWSIYRTAEALARTGHIHYNGWEAPILGWPLYVAAAAMRLFGASYTAARLTVALEGLLTVVLVQRLLVRVGASPWFGCFGALTLGFSPVFFMTSVTFMTDVPGALAVAVCLYAGVRAVQAATDGSAAGWVVVAAAGNAVLGTTRQIAWLGLFVIVPSVLWLLRSRRRVVGVGVAAWGVGCVFVALVLRWFAHQPYVLPEHLFFGPLPADAGAKALLICGKVLLDLLLLTFPVTFAFLVVTGRLSKVWRAVFGGLLLLFLVGMLVSHHFGVEPRAPFLLFGGHAQTPENMFLSIQLPMWGTPPSELSRKMRFAMTVCTAVALLAAGTGLLVRLRPDADVQQRSDERLSWGALLTLTLPFCAAYVLLLLPRGVYFFTVDRYLIFLLVPFLMLTCRLAGDVLAPGVPLVAGVALGVMAVFTIGTMHDLFAIYRANLAAVREVLQQTGLPAVSVMGGAEYDHDQQILYGGWIHEDRIRLPDGSLLHAPVVFGDGACRQPALSESPVMRPVYAMAFARSGCRPAPEFAPVHFSAWLPPFHRSVQVVHYGEPIAVSERP